MAGRAWSGVVDAPGEPVPSLLVSMMEIVVLAQRGTLARISQDAVLVLPKVRTPAAPGTSIRSMSRYARGTEPRADHVNFLLLPWPLQIRASDFRPIEGSAHRSTDDPYGFFDFDPAERLDLDLVDRMLVAARNEVDNIDVVCLPESAITEDELAPLEALLESHGVASLTTGYAKGDRGSMSFPTTGLTGACRRS
jgi:hypothetical protein